MNKDLDVYEELHLRDLLLRRAQAPDFSVQEADFGAASERRLVELLEKRRGYLHQMSNVWEKLNDNYSRVADILSAELQDRDHFIDQLEAASPSKQPNGYAALDRSLRAEQGQRSAVFRARKATLQVTFPPFGPVSLFG